MRKNEAQRRKEFFSELEKVVEREVPFSRDTVAAIEELHKNAKADGWLHLGIFIGGTDQNLGLLKFKGNIDVKRTSRGYMISALTSFLYRVASIMEISPDELLGKIGAGFAELEEAVGN